MKNVKKCPKNALQNDPKPSRCKVFFEREKPRKVQSRDAVLDKNGAMFGRLAKQPNLKKNDTRLERCFELSDDFWNPNSATC